MKEILLLFVLAIAYTGAGKLEEGMIQYEQKVNLHRRLPNPEMKNMIPEFQTSKTQLLFNAKEAYYKAMEDEEEDTEFSNGGMTMRFRRPQSEIYRQFAEARKVELREFLGKKYLIEGKIAQMPWKVTGEMEQVAGYNCMKATLKDSIMQQPRTVVAWFAPDIPVSAGPENFGSLPGMILKIDINEGEMTYTAVKIDAKAMKDSDIEAPTKGKPISEEDYRKMVEEEMKKMGAQGGRMMIRN
ncbi:MAG: GLPGLI family protein [Saprospiraceae bacterium]